MTSEKVDVLINVLGKPMQTTLCLESLMQASGRYIDVIWMNQEAACSQQQKEGLEWIKKRLGKKLRLFEPPMCHWINTVDRAQYAEEAVRLSVRYQYGWERSDKNYVFVTHNDCEYHADIIGPLLEVIGDHFAAGAIGACSGCPAHHGGRCAGGDAYQDYQPDLEQLRAVYREHAEGPPDRAGWCAPFHLSDFNEKYRREPWPLPPCRVNEWCCLVNLRLARPLTMPHGPAMPFGAISDCGDHGLDTSAEWFHDMNRLGGRAKHYPVEERMTHVWGHGATLNPALYHQCEEQARMKLRKLYNVFF